MSKRTPTEELIEEEAGSDSGARRRSSRIAAVVTRRASVTDDAPASITKPKRLSLSQEDKPEADGSKTAAASTPQKRTMTRRASKSPSSLAKLGEIKDIPAMRTRRRASTSSMADEETKKEERAPTPAVSKVTTRRRSLRSMSTSPTSEAAAANTNTSTPRKASRAISASPTADLTKSAPPKLRGRRPSVADKIIPMEAIEETEASKVETQTDETKTESTPETINDENLPPKKKTAAALKKQNLQPIDEKAAEDEIKSDDAKEDKSEEKEEELDINKKASGNEESGSVSPIKAEKKSAETPDSKSKKADRLSLSLKSKRSPEESVEEKELKAVLSVEDQNKAEITNSPRRSPRLSHSENHSPDKIKQPTSAVEKNEVSGESFTLNLSTPEADASQEKMQQDEPEEKPTKSPTTQENGANTSGSSSTSDKENLHLTEVSENGPKEKVLVEKLDIQKDACLRSPRPEKIATPEAANAKKPRASRGSFYEPMEVDDYPSDYDYSTLEKDDKTNQSLTKKLSEAVESPKSAQKQDACKILDEISSNKQKIEPISRFSSPSKLAETAQKNVAEVKVFSLAIELAKPSSPKRRSARLLIQSKSGSSEEECKSVGSSPKLNSTRKSIGEKLENSSVSLNESSVSVEESGSLEKIDNEPSSPSKKNKLEAQREINENTKENHNKSVTAGDDKNVEKSSSGLVSIENGNDSVNPGCVGIQEKGKLNTSSEMTAVEEESKREEASGQHERFDENSESSNKQKSNTTTNNETELGEDSHSDSNKNSTIADASKNNDEPKFSEESESEDDVGNKSKTSARKSIVPKKNEQPKFSEGSSEEIEKEHKSPTKRKSIVLKKNDDPKLSEDSSEDAANKLYSSFKRQSTTRKENDDPKFSETSSEEIEKELNSPTKRVSISLKKNDETKLSEVSTEKNGKERTSAIKRKSITMSTKSSDTSDEKVPKSSRKSKIQTKQESKSSIEDGEEANLLDDSDEDIRAPFYLYTVKPKKTDKVQSPTVAQITINSPTQSEKDRELDEKIQALIAQRRDDSSTSSSSSDESVTHFLDDLADEGEEDTPSEGSNDIVEMGESIGSTESELDNDESYEDDSFIDDEEEITLLSGDEYDLGQEKKQKIPKKKLPRIIPISSDSEDECKEIEIIEQVEEKQMQTTESKGKVANGTEEDSDLEKMSTRPYCGLTPPSIISLRESFSDDDKEDSQEGKPEVTPRVLVNKEDNLESLEQLKQHEISATVKRSSAGKRKSLLQFTSKGTQAVPATLTPNNSILEDDAAITSESSRMRQSSMTIHENINLQNVVEGSVGGRISKMVDIFCSNVKDDEKEHLGNISLSVSLEYSKNEETDKVETGENLGSEHVQKRLSSVALKLDAQNDDLVEKLVEKVLQKRLSSEFKNEPSQLEKTQQLSSNKLKRLSKTQQQKENEVIDLEETGEAAVAKGTQKRLSSGMLKSTSKTDMLQGTSESEVLVEKIVEKVLQKRLSSEFANQPQQPEKALSAKKLKRLSKSQLESTPRNELQKQNVLTKDRETSVKSAGLLNTKQVSKKNQKEKKQNVNKEEKTEEVKFSSSDSDMSDDLDAGLNEKYSSSTAVESDEVEQPKLEIIPRVGKKRSSNVVTTEETTKLVNKDKKGKRDKSATSVQQSKPSVISESDDVFLPSLHEGKRKRKAKKSAEETKPKGTSEASFHPKKKSEKAKKEEEDSKFLDFPSRVLDTMANYRKMITAIAPRVGNPPKKPKLVPSSSSGKRSWSADVVDAPLLPSKTSSKRMQLDVEDFNKKDFKNLMLYDPSRVKRMDSKCLLKKKQK